MRDFRQLPAATDVDLGIPLPDSEHACSVALPTWNSVIGYEEGRDRVMAHLQTGYPRFVRSPQVKQAIQQAAKELNVEPSCVFLFPTKTAAQRAQRWVESRAGVAATSTRFRAFQVVVVPESGIDCAKEYQRLTGEIVSTRLAADGFQGDVSGEPKTHLLQRRLARIYQTDESQCHVFGNGMAAVTSVVRSLPRLAEGKKTLQIEFPYADCLKVQEHFGNGVVFLNEAEGEPFEEALRRISTGEFAAVFTEVPSNPLLRCVDLPKLSAVCRRSETPLVVDDSSVGPWNVRVLSFADVVTGSLTKWLSGSGDVMGGVAVVSKESPVASELLAGLERESREVVPLYLKDTQVMLANLKTFAKRMEQPNRNGLRIAELLSAHPAVETVWHPSITTREAYDKVRTKDGGYGGLLSFALKSARRAAKVYDSLRVSKGPSFGTVFSLACPYVLLAHYRELEWAEGCGVPSHLIRVSCGEEPTELLEEVFTEALRHG